MMLSLTWRTPWGEGSNDLWRLHIVTLINLQSKWQGDHCQAEGGEWDAEAESQRAGGKPGGPTLDLSKFKPCELFSHKFVHIVRSNLSWNSNSQATLESRVATLSAAGTSSSNATEEKEEEKTPAALATQTSPEPAAVASTEAPSEASMPSQEPKPAEEKPAPEGMNLD